MLHKIFFMLLTFYFVATTSGQVNTSMVEGESYFVGMTKSKAHFLKDQIYVKTDESISMERLKENLQLLNNIPGIDSSDYKLDTIGNKVNITYWVKEISTLVPIVNFGGISGNVWGRVGITDYNFLGLGQFFSATYQNNNGLHSGHIFYKIPRRHKSKWGYTSSLNSWASKEPLYFEDATVEYVYNNHGLGLSAIRHLDNKTTIEVGNTAFVEVYNKVNQNNNENLPGPESLVQKKLLSKIALSRNKVDYDHFYRTGGMWNLTYQNVYTANDDLRFNSLILEGQHYFRPKEKVNLAIRIKLGISTNTDSPFAPFVADSHVNIRGIGNRISRGTAEAVVNLEYRWTTYKGQTWSTQFVAFADIGSWRSPGGSFKNIFYDDNISKFVGVGYRIIYSKLYGATIRIDYGVDTSNLHDRGLVLGLGQYF